MNIVLMETKEGTFQNKTRFEVHVGTAVYDDSEPFLVGKGKTPEEAYQDALNDALLTIDLAAEAVGLISDELRRLYASCKSKIG